MHASDHGEIGAELPEADIVSLILTGTVSGDADRSTIAAVTQSGLGLAQSILSASLSEQLERGTQRLFGLSRFSIDPLLVGRGNDPTARITVGQRITRTDCDLSHNLPRALRIERVGCRISVKHRFPVVGFRNDGATRIVRRSLRGSSRIGTTPSKAQG